MPGRTVLSLVAAAAASILAGCAAPPEVDIDGGTYTGQWRHAGHIAEFLGVPFAMPPLGERRWLAPQPLSEPGDYSATAYAPACMQGRHMIDWYRDVIRRFDGDPGAFPVPELSEDCLYLNVWTPRPAAGAALPVMVWIHGGSHRGGWSYEPNYIGDVLASRGVVVVSIAYRLDVFGFFSHPGLPESNFGLLDQVAALEWIQRHIREFGGDPDNVTVFGESAGAASAGYLLASPLAKGLFQRLIHQSAGYELRHDDRREDFLDQGARLEARVLGSGGKSGIGGLRAAPAEILLAAAAEVYADDQPDVVIDGHSLRTAPRDLLREGRLETVDLLVGTNADEWKMYLDADTGREDVEQWLEEHRAPGSALALLAGQAPLRQLDRLITADQFVCPSLALADYMAAAGKGVYVYWFSRERPGRLGAEMGAYHGIEIPYIFDHHDDWLPTDGKDREITRLMSAYWSAFARSGNPNNGNLPVWPAWQAESPTVLEIGSDTRRIAHPERALCTLPGTTD